MRWLLHGSIAPAVTEALVRHGHIAPPVEEVIPTDAEELLRFAAKKQFDLMTADREFAHGLLDRNHKFNRSIVHLQLSGGDVEQDDAIDRLFNRYKRLKPGMLYTVTETRVKARQLPGL